MKAYAVNRPAVLLAVCVVALQCALVVGVKEPIGGYSGFNSANPNFPDYNNPDIQTLREFFGELESSPVDPNSFTGKHSCDMCRSLISVSFEEENCRAAYKARQRPELSDEDTVDEECASFKAEVLQELPSVWHSVSWYTCSCLGACDGDCYYRPELKSNDAWMQESPVKPIGQCKEKTVDVESASVAGTTGWKWDRCVGARIPNIGWKRSLKVSANPDTCTRIKNDMKRDECQWMENAIENMMESKLDGVSGSVDEWGLADYGAFYACSCLGCKVPEVDCQWNGPRLNRQNTPYSVATFTGMPQGLMPSGGSQGTTENAITEHNGKVDEAYINSLERNMNNRDGAPA